MTNKEASQKYRNKDPEKYRAYQRDYKARRYDNDDIRIGLLKTAKEKYYYSVDPLPCIRKLFN
tara:strand:- start:2107 stop:2295 length:189 start_codon:yes stop_codon:yes gene_type:complete